MRREGLEIHPVDFLQNLSVRWAPTATSFRCLTTRSCPAPSAPVYLVDCPACYERGAIYTADPTSTGAFCC